MSAPFHAPAHAQPVAESEARSGGLDLETLIAGRWLNRVGILALLFACWYFLKYAFDNNWIGPSGRVAVMLVAGTLLLVYSQWLLGRGYLFFSEGIGGLGAGVLYAALYTGWSYYHVLPQGMAFAGMIAVTAALVVIALGRNSQRVALIALVGGFLTPMLVSTGIDQQVILFTYLAVLNAGMLAVGRARDWRSLELLCFIATQLYFWGWYDQFYKDPKLLRTAAFATLFFVQFAALPVLRSRRLGLLPGRQVVLVLANASWYLLALRVLLWDDHRWALTVAVLALAAAHLAVARTAPRAGDEKDKAFVRILFAGLALTFVTLAIPIRLEGKWITMAWAVEGAVLVWSGFATRVRLLRGAGLLLFGVTAFRLAFVPIEAHRFLLNPRFFAFAVAVVCFALALYFARTAAEQLGDDEAGFFAMLGVAVNVYALWGLSLEVWDLFGRIRFAAAGDQQLAQQLGLSLLWILYASVLTVAGFRTGQAALRWQGIVLFGLVVVKVFLLDLSFLERFYRIVSFVTLGVVLLVVSFYYQRRLAQRAAGGAPPEVQK